MAKSSAASMGAISDPILMLLSCLRLKGPSVSLSNPCLGLETHGGEEVSCGGHFHVPSRCKIGVPALLPPSLSVARPSPIPILVWKHDEPHFHVERTRSRTDGRASEQTVVWRPNLVPKLAPRLSASTPPPRCSPAVRSNFPSEHSHSTTTTTLNNEGCKGSGEMRDETTAWHGMACTDRGPSFLPSFLPSRY